MNTVFIKEVLYFHDTPCIFTAIFNDELVIFYKYNETKFVELFVMSPVDQVSIDRIKKNELSIYGGFGEDSKLVQLDTNNEFSILVCDNFINCLPPKGLGLMPSKTPLPDK